MGSINQGLVRTLTTGRSLSLDRYSIQAQSTPLGSHDQIQATITGHSWHSFFLSAIFLSANAFDEGAQVRLTESTQYPLRSVFAIEGIRVLDENRESVFALQIISIIS